MELEVGPVAISVRTTAHQPERGRAAVGHAGVQPSLVGGHPAGTEPAWQKASVLPRPYRGLVMLTDLRDDCVLSKC